MGGRVVGGGEMEKGEGVYMGGLMDMIIWLFIR